MLLSHVCISFVFFCMDSPPQHITTSTKLAESPLPVNLYSDLSPLKSVTSHGSQSFALSSPPPVFMSPRGQNCPNSKTMDSTDLQYFVKNCNSEQSRTPLEYLASNPQDMAHKSSQCLAQNVEICRNESDQSSRMTAEVSVKADQHHSNVFRHLQFGPTILDETPNSSNLSLPEALLPICNVIPSQNEVCKTPSSSGKASAASLLTSLMAESFEPKSNYLDGRSRGVHSRFGLPFSSITRSLSMDSISTPFRSVGNQNVQELVSPSYPFTEVQPQPDSIFRMPAIPENRKRTKDLIDPEGCRTCNCKKSKCLKLYCDCFANGDYCQETCSCENCLNKRDYEDTVLDTRQQIETRNPLAFTPKVVNPTARTPIYITGNANSTTPASARHKRGCNCKKSKCLKKYCECYQAGVGCYNACRCENCENPSGRKSGSVHRRIENWEYTPPAVAFENQNFSESSSSQISERKVLSEMNSDKMFGSMLEEYPIPGILRKTSNPIKPAKATSPNKKAVSPPQTQPNGSSPNTSEAARDFR